jgi:hypothetical protein
MSGTTPRANARNGARLPTNTASVDVDGRPSRRYPDEGVPHFLGQWQSREAATLATHVNRCALPIDVAKVQLLDVPGPKPETRQ